VCGGGLVGGKGYTGNGVGSVGVGVGWVGGYCIKNSNMNNGSICIFLHFTQ
jgi:hypothetical protein